MAREQRKRPPRLEALLDERDHLRIKINLAEGAGTAGDEIAQMRRLLFDIDRDIQKHWSSPNA